MFSNYRYKNICYKMTTRLLNVVNSKYIRFISSQEKNKITTAGVIVIGDEILKGEVADTNSAYLAKELHELGLQLKKISVIGDEVREVSNEVKLFSRSYDHVITTGGIGPTHDDITYEAVAMAFNESLTLNPELCEICMKFYKTTNVNSPGMKLAYIPKNARLNFVSSEGVRMMYPNVSIRNVYMFPGIPELLRKSFSNLKDILFKSCSRFHTKILYLNATEDKIVTALDKLVKEFPDVRFGSYPKLFHEKYKVKVTIESCCESSTQKAFERLKKLMPNNFVVDFFDPETK